ncbi:uncharacterized protein LOC132697150 [Cylas formicarius]|uniref:uncharacterized protein LOC132697150 n=1 Tax=Cylas formicarius TaxID=197179 RepID=UPI002958A69A|nr:uncharacterized protein LOC132697150 [Cylas formicarius]
MERHKCEKFIKGKDSTFVLRKALVLIEHPITKYHCERHKKILNDFVIVSHDGFYAKELVDVTKLIDKLKESEFYQKHLRDILQLCSIPPKLAKSSDLLSYNADIIEYFSWLGYLLVWALGKPIQFMTAQLIHELLAKDFPNQKNYLPLTVRREKAQQSKLPDVLGEILHIVDENIYPLILDIIGYLLHGCPGVYNSFLQQNAVNSIVIRFEPTWQERFPDIKPPFPNIQQDIANLDTALMVLHILLKYPTRENPIMQAPTRFMLWNLQWAFRLCTIKERRALKRNNILAILIKLLNIFPDALSGNTTFAYDIAKMAFESNFSKNSAHWSNKIRFSTSSEDHRCLSLLLVCISYFSNCITGAKIIEECRVMIGLMKLINNEQQIPWNPLQRCFLLDLVLSVLTHLIPCGIDDFLEDGGPHCLLRVVHKSREVVGYDIVSNCLEVLDRFSRHNSSVKNSVRYNKGLFIVTELAKNLIKTGPINHKKQNCLKSVFNFLQHFCETNSEVLDVISLAMAYLKRYVNPTNEDPIQDPKLIIFVLNFVWMHFPTSNEFCDEFIKMDGVYLLLDITQMSCFTIKLVALGALVDLCEVAQCIPYLITWRAADTGQGIVSLLMAIFRAENKELLVKTGPNGEILDTMLPIMGKVQFYETFCMCSKSSGCASIADLFLSCRPKVYCLVQILNNLQRETVEIANDFYQLYNEKLSVEDEITLLLADNFLALKQSEQWTELLKELEKCGNVLTPSDKVTLDTMIEVTHKWSACLRKTQMMVLNESHSEECAKERSFYRLLREGRLSEALGALSRIKYIARCSERLFRISSNLNLRNQIDKSLEHETEHRKLHRTLMSNLSVNCQHSQSVSVPSGVFSFVEVKEDLSLISPIPSLSDFVPVDECSPNNDLTSKIIECNETEIQ